MACWAIDNRFIVPAHVVATSKCKDFRVGQSMQSLPQSDTTFSSIDETLAPGAYAIWLNLVRFLQDLQGDCPLLMERIISLPEVTITGEEALWRWLLATVLIKALLGSGGVA